MVTCRQSVVDLGTDHRRTVSSSIRRQLPNLVVNPSSAPMRRRQSSSVVNLSSIRRRSVVNPSSGDQRLLVAAGGCGGAPPHKHRSGQHMPPTPTKQPCNPQVLPSALTTRANLGRGGHLPGPGWGAEQAHTQQQSNVSPTSAMSAISLPTSEFTHRRGCPLL